ncbi:MAG: hypothetical protein LAP85_24425 [Acidobacteriia bacterium]|nr:hypothetical protein [Terriglobia bacterium]
MLGRMVVLMMSWIVASGNAIQAPPTPTFFVGTWTNASERSGGPASFTVVYRDDKTFITIRPQAESEFTLPELEATAYRLISTGSGPLQNLEPSALVAYTEQILYVFKRTDAGKVVLEIFTKPGPGRGGLGRGPYYSSEPYDKSK